MDPLKPAVLYRLLLVALVGACVLPAPGLAASKSRSKSTSQTPSRTGGQRGRDRSWSDNASRRRQQSRHQDKSQAEYNREIARKVARARTPEDFLRVFFPADTIKARWTKMLNESVQNAWRAGRTETEAVDSDRPTLTEKLADEEWAALYREATGVWCRVPKLVLIDMYEELNIRRGMEQLFPSCMKVYRCAGSGCCSDERHHCVANESARTNVTWLFLRTFKGPDGVSTNMRVQYHTLYNDTECLCRERQLECAPKACTDATRFNPVTCRCECRRRCPKPFRLNHTTCDCSCDDNDGPCNKIKRAKRTMSPPECKCVLDELCSVPPCRKGYQFVPNVCQCVQDGKYLSRRNRNRDRDRERERERNRSPGQDHQRTDLPRMSGRTAYGTDTLPSSSYDEEEEDEEEDGGSSSSAQLPSVSSSSPGETGPGAGPGAGPNGVASVPVGDDLLVVWDVDADAELDADAEMYAEIDADADAEMDAVAQMDADAERDADAQMDADAETDADAQMDAETPPAEGCISDGSSCQQQHQQQQHQQDPSAQGSGSSAGVN